MTAVALYNILTGHAYMPSQVRIATQIISGLFIGINIHKEDIAAIRSIAGLAVLLTVGILGFGLILSTVVYHMTDYDVMTSMFSSSPAGLVDVTLISYDLGADVTVVSLMQLSRLCGVLLIVPPLIKKIVSAKAKENTLIVKAQEKEIQKALDNYHKPGYREMAVTFLFAAAGGLIGYSASIPAGTLMFSMIGVAFQNIFFKNAYMPKITKSFAQVFAGAMVGESVTYEALLRLKEAFLPAGIIVAGFVVMTVLLGMLLYKTSDLDLATALFACMPGGASDVALIAGDLGGDTAKVALFQIMRVIGVVVIYPIIVRFLQVKFF